MTHFKQLLLTILKEGVVFVLIGSPLLYIGLTDWDSSKGYRTLTFFIFFALISTYAAFIEPQVVVVKQHTLKIKGLKKKFRIVFFTDIHVGPHKQSNFVKRVVKKVNSLRADLVFIGGDFITGEDIHPQFLTPLKNLEANKAKVAVLGNHDYNLNFASEIPRLELAKKVEEKLEAMGIKVLRNESVELFFENEILTVVGIDDLWAHRENVEKAFARTNELHPVIVLCHNPDIALQLQDRRVDVLLSGHTHGGTLRIPFLGAVFPFLKNIHLKSKYLKGFNKYKSISMFVSSGLGETVTRMRFLFNFPEIIIFDLDGDE